MELHKFLKLVFVTTLQQLSVLHNSIFFDKRWPYLKYRTCFCFKFKSYIPNLKWCKKKKEDIASVVSARKLRTAETLSASQIIYRWMIRWLMNGVDTILKEAAVTNFSSTIPLTAWREHGKPRLPLNSRFPGRVMNPKPRGYEPGVLVTIQRSSTDGNISYGALGQKLFDNIKIDLKEMWYESIHWIRLAQQISEIQHSLCI
jgi:hypothetical protein